MFWANASRSRGIVSLVFAEAFLIVGFVNILTSSVSLATNEAENYQYPYRGVEGYLYDLRSGIVIFLVGLGIVFYWLLPGTAKKQRIKEIAIEKIHADFNRVHKDIGPRSESWRNKRRLLAGKGTRDPLEMSIVITVLAVIAIALGILFVRSVFGQS